MFLFLSSLLTLSAAALTGQELVDHVNKQGLWKASLSPLPRELIRRRIMDVQYAKRRESAPPVHHPPLRAALPKSFDARTAWPRCPSIGVVSDQGDCGDCWAFSAAAVMSDRICIHSNAQQKVNLSVIDLNTCCADCVATVGSNGCHGGFHDKAWAYYVSTGISSGGYYGTNAGCKPYPFKPCKHVLHPERAAGERDPPCAYPYADAPACSQHCRPGSGLDYEGDRHRGKTYYDLPNNVAAIQAEILLNGPVQTSFVVYEDFYHYSSGIYVHVGGGVAGAHAVKIVGWGVENGTPYWTIVNSFGPDWGEGGSFRIVRGLNECTLEENCTAGLPLLS